MEKSDIKKFQKTLEKEIMENIPATILISLIDIVKNNAYEKMAKNPEDLELQKEGLVVIETLTLIVNLYEKEAKKMVKGVVKTQTSALEKYYNWLEEA